MNNRKNTFIVIGCLLIIIIYLVSCSHNRPTVDDVIDYTNKGYSSYSYNSDEYVSNTDYWDAAEEFQKALKDAYEAGFKQGAQDALDYYYYEVQ